MDMLKLSLSLLCVFSIITMLPPSLGQDSPQDYVDAHNDARARARGQDSAVQFGIQPIQPIQWDEEVANYARQYANERSNDCQLLHSNSGTYGENLAMSFGEMSGIQAVEMWVNEKQFYDYDSNTCVEDKMCGHYTQVVWNNSTKVGCAKVRCSNGGTFITCNYDPPGNVIGERPY
ncbi:pathogenesis-related protein 1-like [Benincasa hispida]|uniref:pathogenesis-related protein 1-like n=1 Tax=Benincasa hispida TaxID=102211 RepID=UPI0018FF8203|nr:pathogenesis-related protein 1-like [Benincasa hispida]XP_038888746.1 pathogenesis-related protein 1-like [Benincasa hispida]